MIKAPQAGYQLDWLKEEHIPEFMEMIRDHIAEGYPDMTCDPEFLRESLHQIIGSGLYFCRLVFAAKALRAYYLGVACPYLFTDSFQIILNYIYIRPEYRGTMIFARMMKDFEQECKRHGSYDMTVGIDSGNNVDKVGRIFEKRGFKFVGNFYKKRCNV